MNRLRACLLCSLLSWIRQWIPEIYIADRGRAEGIINYEKGKLSVSLKNTAQSWEKLMPRARWVSFVIFPITGCLRNFCLISQRNGNTIPSNVSYLALPKPRDGCFLWQRHELAECSVAPHTNNVKRVGTWSGAIIEKFSIQFNKVKICPIIICMQIPSLFLSMSAKLYLSCEVKFSLPSAFKNTCTCCCRTLFSPPPLHCYRQFI